MTGLRYAALAGLLGLLPMLLSMSVDGTLPLMASIAATFGTSAGPVQLSLSALVLGIAAGQLVYGPLSDLYGRKPVIVAGVLLFGIASFMCGVADTLPMLITMRFLQGFFACSGVIVARAVIRDLFDREAGARLFSLMMAVHGIMPASAPAIGGWLAEARGWRAMFFAMAIFALLAALAVALGLTESNKARNSEALRPSTLVRNYRFVLANRVFRSYAGCACFAYSALFAYFAGAPVALIEYLGMSPHEAGLVMAAPMVAYILAQFGVARIAHRVGLEGLIRIGTSGIAIAGIGMTSLVGAGIVNVFTLMAPVILMLVALAFITPATTAGAMSGFPQLAGAASSLLGFIQFIAGAATTATVGLASDGTPLPMAIAIGLLTVGALGAWRLLIRPLSARTGQ